MCFCLGFLSHTWPLVYYSRYPSLLEQQTLSTYQATPQPPSLWWVQELASRPSLASCSTGTCLVWPRVPGDPGWKCIIQSFFVSSAVFRILDFGRKTSIKKKWLSDVWWRNIICHHGKSKHRCLLEILRCAGTSLLLQHFFFSPAAPSFLACAVGDRFQA